MRRFLVSAVSICIIAGGGASLMAQSTHTLTLTLKESVFAKDMRERFVFNGQAAPKLKLPREGRPLPTYNMPDNAYLTGIYAGCPATKYAVTRDESVRAELADAIGALERLATVSGHPGLLARAAVPLDMPFDDDGEWLPSPDGKHKWRTDVSCDQVTGFMYGCAMAFDLAADEAPKDALARIAGRIASHIIDNGLRIIDHHGEPTKWGKYYLFYVQSFENLNGLDYLAAYWMGRYLGIITLGME